MFLNYSVESWFLRTYTWILEYYVISSVSRQSDCNAGDLGSIPGSGRSPGGGMATHSSILAWRIPWSQTQLKQLNMSMILEWISLHVGTDIQQQNTSRESARLKICALQLLKAITKLFFMEVIWIHIPIKYTLIL